MMVIFTSMSEKKAIPNVRRILDMFADRIGHDTWKTVITQEGLSTVHTLLRHSATKNTAVACHWIRSRSRSDLLWIVGNKKQFNEFGCVPVHRTSKHIAYAESDQQWQFLPQLKAFVALGALFHDLGKATKLFSDKLRGKNAFGKDPYRHEWVSCKIIEAIVEKTESRNDDSLWLQALADGKITDQDIKSTIKTLSRDTFGKLPPIAAQLVWVILSHHRLPSLSKEHAKRYYSSDMPSFYSMCSAISAKWGYADESRSDKDAESCFTFPKGLLFDTGKKWNTQVKKWAGRMLEVKNKEWWPRLFLQYARLCLMLADHYVSSQPSEGEWPNQKLWANTDRTGELKQSLEEHSVRIMKQALTIAHSLPIFQHHMQVSDTVAALDKRSTDKRFSWQDKAVDSILSYKKNIQGEQSYFVINMASTGCGKTFANAKIIRSLGRENRNLRYLLALGLRTLTLQTGDEYRHRIGLHDDDLAVLIGSSVIQELHDKDRNNFLNEDTFNDRETDFIPEEAEESLLDNELYFDDTCSKEQQKFLDLFFHHEDSKKGGQGTDGRKNEAFLYKPVLVLTIDYLMKATETVRGSKYMLPFLRLMSSDIVIDEIDDFSKKDLIAIARLVHLAGMMGRNVVLSSATIPADLAAGMYRAYNEGLQCYRNFFSSSRTCSVIFCDEFKTVVSELVSQDSMTYREMFQKFSDRRKCNLMKQPVKRKGYIVPLPGIESAPSFHEKEIQYFEQICQEIETLHHSYHVQDKRTGKNVSFGLIRMANIRQCVALTLYLLRRKEPRNVAIRTMSYHSRQLILLRHVQEQYLDRVLKRKGRMGDAVVFDDAIICRHIDYSEEQNIIFLVISTPVEEVGRDHDFDWAIVEPSSYRSLIQISGRILRHRLVDVSIDRANVAVMQYNLRSLQGMRPAFCHPGYEGTPYLLESYDMNDLVDVDLLQKRIDSIIRISHCDNLYPTKRLIDLEQQVMKDFNDESQVGPASMQGWIQEYWWLTALPQYFNRFREQYMKEIEACYLLDEGEFYFGQYEDGQWMREDDLWNITQYDKITKDMKKRLWITRSYQELLQSYSSYDEEDLRHASSKFGRVMIPLTSKPLFYSDQLGVFTMNEDDV